MVKLLASLSLTLLISACGESDTVSKASSTGLFGLKKQLSSNASTSDSYAQYAPQVQEMYVAYYGRPADPGGLEYWSKRIYEANGKLDEIIQDFGNSSEADARFKSLGVEGAVVALYRQLFGREPDSEGFNYYVNGIKEGRFSLVTVSANIFYGAQSATSDGQMLLNKVTVANGFTEVLRQNPSLLEDYAGNQAASVAREFLESIGPGISDGQLSAAEYENTFKRLADALSDEEADAAAAISVTVTSI